MSITTHVHATEATAIDVRQQIIDEGRAVSPITYHPDRDIYTYNVYDRAE